MLVEGDIQSVGQLHLVLVSVYLNLLDRLAGVGGLQIALDGLGNEVGGNGSLLAIHLGEVALLVKLELGAILQHHVVTLVYNAGLYGGEHHLLLVEVRGECGLCLGRKIAYINGLVVVGSSRGATQHNAAKGNQHHSD